MATMDQTVYHAVDSKDYDDMAQARWQVSDVIGKPVFERGVMDIKMHIMQLQHIYEQPPSTTITINNNHHQQQSPSTTITINNNHHQH